METTKLEDITDETPTVTTSHAWTQTKKGAEIHHTSLITHASLTCPRIKDGEMVGMALGVAEWPCGECITVASDSKTFAAEPVQPERSMSQGTSAGKGRGNVATIGTPCTEDEAADFVRSLGRKVEVDEVTPELHGFAQEWAKAWTGDFAFMVDMHEAATNGKLSKAQAKGVLNCFRADVLRNGTKSEPKTTTQASSSSTKGDYEPQRGDVHVVDGRYFRVSIGQGSGNAYATEWDGSRWEYAKGAIRKLSAETVATAEQAAEFGHAFNKCVFCTHDLDVDRSITVGYGPTCAQNKGLPW